MCSICIQDTYKWQIAKTSYKIVQTATHTRTHNALNIVVKMEILIIHQQKKKRNETKEEDVCVSRVEQLVMCDMEGDFDFILI